MVQMGDAPSVDRAIFYLNGLDFFNTKMNVKYEVIQYLYLINDFSFFIRFYLQLFQTGLFGGRVDAVRPAGRDAFLQEFRQQQEQSLPQLWHGLEKSTAAALQSPPLLQHSARPHRGGPAQSFRRERNGFPCRYPAPAEQEYDHKFIRCLFVFINFYSIFWAGEKSSSGHLEFSTLQEAVEALVICNHIPLSGASTFYSFKLNEFYKY